MPAMPVVTVSTSDLDYTGPYDAVNPEDEVIIDQGILTDTCLSL